MLALLARVIVVAGVLLSASLAQAEKRVALVIGNGAYRNAVNLNNPVNDARGMAAKLRGLGFTVVDGYDVDRNAFQSAVWDFARLAKDADLSLFFYAGHGIAADDKNYLLPIDVKLEDATGLDFEAMPVDFIERQMHYSEGVSLIFLDACRNNPFADAIVGKSRSVGRGLAEMRIADAGKGLAIAFATSPGKTAKDGAGDHSPFTTALLAHIDEPNTDITQVMSRVTGDVLRDTDEGQRPWLNVSLTGPVILNPVVAALTPPAGVVSDVPTAGVAAAASAGVAAAPAFPSFDPTETLLFNIARDTNDINDYRAYLDRFPAGVFAPNARNAIERLSAKPQQVAALPPAEPSVAGSAATAPAAAPAGETDRAAEADADRFVLPVTDAVRAAPADAATEAALQLDRDKIRDIQNRLNIAGAKAGRANGSIGAGLRAAIRRWQAANGLTQTGFLNSLQLQVLTSQTEGEEAAAVTTASIAPEAVGGTVAKAPAAGRSASGTRSIAPAQQKATRAPAKSAPAKRTASRAPSSHTASSSSRSRSSGNGGAAAEAMGRFVGGVVGGMLRN